MPFNIELLETLDG